MCDKKDLAQENAELHVENADLKKEVKQLESAIVLLIESGGVSVINKAILTRTGEEG